MKVDNEIITSHDIEQEINYLKALNPGLKQINKDELFWRYHVSDLKGWQSEGAKKYGVRSIPSNVLIDSNGIIIAHNLKGAALHRFLESQKK